MTEPFDERIRRYVHSQAPLGPSDSARIKDLEVAARLFDPHNKSFNSLLRKDLSVVIGRRGSGKTALVTSYKYRPYLAQSGSVEPEAFGSDFSAYNLVIEIATHKKFEELQRRVVKDQSVFRPIESIVEDWEKLITDYFLATLLSSDFPSRKSNGHLMAINSYLQQDDGQVEDEVRQLVWEQTLWAKWKAMRRDAKGIKGEFISQDEIMDRAMEYLKTEKKKAVIIFDSMDEYPIGNHSFDRTVGALVRFISDSNSRRDRIKIKLVLPSEIFPEVQEASGNPLKDMVNFDQVQWSPLELMQIAAYRYKLFLELYDPECFSEIKRLDLNQREQVHRFWRRFFPRMHTNRYGNDEDTLTYILRHTQLLPRQLFRILERIIMDSQKRTGGYRQFSSRVIRNAIEEMEPVIAGEIFTAFRNVYPHANQLGKAVFGNFPTIFSYDALEDQWRKKARHQMSKVNTEFEMVHFSEMLIRMGIMGLVVAEEETERYYQGQFGYGLLTPFNIGGGNNLCLHPIFSKHFNASGNPKSKAILPQDVTIEGE